MSYDLFISYSRKDNVNGQVTALKEHIEKSFRAFAGRDLRVFFDTHEIQGMDDWRQKIQRSLRESHLFLAVLSPEYLASPYCRWEWEDYVRYEAMRQCLGEGVAPVFFVALPSADPKADPAVARWMEEIQKRQTFDLRPWHDQGEKALEEAHVKSTLDDLNRSVRERLDRADQARRSPDNLIKHNPAFVGRVRELTELRNALTKNKLGVVGGRAAVQGLGGMGKTELALAYAHAFAWDYPGGRWQVPCEHIGDLRLALSRLAGPMGFEFTEDEKKDLELQFVRILREIEKRERCLIILDNVSDSQILEPHLLDRLPRDGRVDLIATTRLAPAQIPGSAQEQAFVAVDELPEEDALALMRSHQPDGRFASDAEDEEARAIVKLLRGFTLAVETAGIYLGRHPGPDACKTFRARLSPELLSESEKAARDPAVAVRHRMRSLDETLAPTLATLSPEAIHLLEFAALLPADQVAVPWLKSLGSERFPVFSDDTQPAFREQIDLLLGLRLFQTTGVDDPSGRPLVVRMHRLVQDLLRQKSTKEELDEKEESVGDLITAREADLENETRWEEAAWEIEPLDATASLWAETNHPGADWLLNGVGRHWKTLAQWARSEAMLRRSLAIIEKTLGPRHADAAGVLGNLSQTLTEMARYAEAEPLAKRALSIHEDVQGPGHPSVATAMNDLALLFQATNRPGEAEPLFRRALAINEKALGPYDAKVATVLNNLATLLVDMNRLEEAEPLLRQALAADERTLGPEHPDVARDLGNLAQLLEDMGRTGEAEHFMRRAMNVDEQCYGLQHPNIALSLNNLAQLLTATGRVGEAEPLAWRALRIDEEAFGPNHPSVARDLNNLAGLIRRTGRPAEAESFYRRALSINENILGPDHPEVAGVLNNLAQLLQNANRQDEAEPLMRRVLAIDEKAFGPNHPALGRDLNNLAGLLLGRGRVREAVDLCRRAAAIAEETMSDGNPGRAVALHNLAVALMTNGQLSEAESLMKRAVSILLEFRSREGQRDPNEETFVAEYNDLASRVGKSGRDRGSGHRPWWQFW